ncbi:PIN domain-containing protein [Paragemmobacter straminiformis]|uniref:Ribonuclease VapC n=1 Tax=Paragemmobacter straminiformis TaxID=2045119 RepID=A0A842IB61_9RHOB|nr:PIN domain-containing protein [Gemmobacter straminiformis]MBC2836228.1 PIN domain-containing protein [Gemmobacter straminiformis]
MILLDTPVLAALLRADPSPALLDWFAGQPAASLYVSTVTEAELLTAATRQPQAKRLIAAIDEMMDTDFSGRILPFDSAAARDLAAINARNSLPAATAMLAAIARANGATLATDTPDAYAVTGIETVNPYDPR